MELMKIKHLSMFLLEYQELLELNIVGEVNLPGTYNFSAFNTIYNAIYVAGGITENATLRDIKLYRNNKLVRCQLIYINF